MTTETTKNPNELMAYKLLDLLARFRILAENQLEDFFGEKITQNLEALKDHGIIVDRIVPTLDGEQKRILGLSRRGAKLLSLNTGKELLEIPSFTPSTLKRSLFTLEHSLLVAEVGLTLLRLEAEQDDFKLRFFETSPQKIGDSVMIPTKKGTLRVPLVADAFFGLSCHGENPCFLLEVDRGTTSLPRMRRKFQGYALWRNNQGPENRLSAKNLRLLILSPNSRRLERLKQAALEVSKGQGAGFFWFGLQEIFDLKLPGKILCPVWQKANGGQEEFLSLFTRCPGP